MLKGKTVRMIGLYIAAFLVIMGLFACGQPDGPTIEAPTAAPTEVPATEPPTVTETLSVEPLVTEVVEPTVALPLLPQIEITSGPQFCQRLLGGALRERVGLEIDPNLSHMPGQLIFTGEANDINLVISAVNSETDINLTPLNENEAGVINLADLLAGTEITLGNGPSDPVVQLYMDSHQPGQTVETLRIVTRIISRLTETDGISVFADLNYVIASPWDVEGSPWDVEGSPWDVEGSPWDVEGSADWFFVPIGPDSLDTYLDQLGLAYIDQSDRPFSGEGSKVVIFDTSPFMTPGYRDVGHSGYELCVVHPEQPVGPYLDAGISTVSQHGFFIGGLANLTAPDSDLYLIRALDEGKGDLFNVLRIMMFYMTTACEYSKETTSATTCGGSLSDTVFNLSFGFRPENVPELSNPETFGYRDLIDQMWDLVPEHYFGLSTSIGFSGMQASMRSKQSTDTQIPVVAISLATVIANELGGRVVAAAGNSSAIIPSHRTPDIPARLYQVTGVASQAMVRETDAIAVGETMGYDYIPPVDPPTDVDSTFFPDAGGGIVTSPLSCYSNFGSLDDPGLDQYFPGMAVPGGDGYSSMAPYKCEPSLELCQDGYCVISTIYNPVSNSSYFIYWAGTSFATPLYAGMVASGAVP